MPSPTDTEPKKLAVAPSWMKVRHVAGNHKAHELANDAAKFNQILKNKGQSGPS